VELPIIVLIVSAMLSTSGLLLAVLSFRQKAGHDYVAGLEGRIERLEAEVKDCHEERERCARERTELLTQLCRYATHYPPPPGIVLP
jgi:hypothetical protein